MTILGPFFTPRAAFAEDGVSLLVWVEDSGKELPKALTREKFNAALKIWGEMGVGPIRAVFIENGQSDKLEQRVEEAILPSDRIVNLIISTHGSTKLRKNRVSLQDLGDFDASGSSGHLHNLIQLLGPHLGSDLNISFQACSTACGTTGQIESRVDGIRRELAPFGVKRLSVWGAKVPLAFDDQYQAVSNERSKGQIKQLLGRMAGGSVVAGVGIGALAFAMISNFGFDYQSLQSALMIGGADTAFTFAGLYALVYNFVGSTDTKGHLVISEGGQTQTLEVESGTINAVHSTRARCEALLSPKAAD